jgi:hypothetical protein
MLIDDVIREFMKTNPPIITVKFAVTFRISKNFVKCVYKILSKILPFSRAILLVPIYGFKEFYFGFFMVAKW